MSAYRRAVGALALVMVAIGVTMVVLTLARGGGVGILLGALFVAAGAGRLVMLRRGSR